MTLYIIPQNLRIHTLLYDPDQSQRCTFPRYIKPRNFAKRQCERQWLVDPLPPNLYTRRLDDRGSNEAPPDLQDFWEKHFKESALPQIQHMSPDAYILNLAPQTQ